MNTATACLACKKQHLKCVWGPQVAGGGTQTCLRRFDGQGLRHSARFSLQALNYNDQLTDFGSNASPTSHTYVVEIGGGDGASAVSRDSRRHYGPIPHGSTLGLANVGSVPYPLMENHEVRLMQYYLTYMCTWFDLCDSRRHFANIVPPRAASCPTLLNAIFALSSRHLSLNAKYDPYASDRYHQACLRHLATISNDSSALNDDNLLAATILLRTLEELDVPLIGTDHEGHLLGIQLFMNTCDSTTTPSSLRLASFWIGMRQEVTMSFASQRPVKIRLDHGFMDRSLSEADDDTWANRIIVHSADVINYCFGNNGPNRHHYQELVDYDQAWLRARPVSWLPVAYSASDETLGEAFPHIIYLNHAVVIGQVHSIFARILLMCHDDRVPRIGPSAQLARKQIDVGQYPDPSPRTLRDSSLKPLHKTRHLHSLHGSDGMWRSIYREKGPRGVIGCADADPEYPFVAHCFSAGPFKESMGLDGFLIQATRLGGRNTRDLDPKRPWSALSHFLSFIYFLQFLHFFANLATLNAMAPRKLQVGVAGLGRMGKRHALNFHQNVPRAVLVAVSSPDAAERDWATENLAPDGVAIYENYSDMMAHVGLDAVCVASATAVHAEQTNTAIAAGKHVLCEKPLGTTVEISQSVVDAAATRPDLKVMCGFSRRFDASYRDAYEKTKSGLIGRPSVLRSQTCDVLDPSGFFVAYAQFSGGIFVDCSIHDIDLALWFFGQESKVRSVHAVGITAVEPDLRQYDDRDNAVGIVEFYDGRIAYLYASRMMAAGQEDTTEIIGTKGKLSVNLIPVENHVRIYGQEGIRHELPQNYWGRFQAAFTREAIEFTECVLDDKPVPVGLESAVTAVRIGAALQRSMIMGNKIHFDEGGNEVNRAQL
ncbi:myo-inositol 2-dehydrogenase [Fusarium pseudoanthophilum]|uniref:Myo-inositol 2-dehydrogenase n=1 Tax=Fusarium pseudoanthophilum TaxID=48495 RepID=A0A8H5KQL2_9HYPO|nr:myo-inositol 2-dehydrogenase [Fusarium pseudoanthophilum]